MKLIVALLSTATAATTVAQTAAHAPAHRSATAAAHSSATCVRVPEASAKIPALPPGVSCAKVLFTLRVEPPVKLQYVSPVEGTAVQDTLGLGDEDFSLLYVDTKQGTGALAQPKKWYSIRYTGYLPDGSVFDSNADKPDQPFSFPYGAHRVINGWDTGFAGMHVGGKRRLFIPYQLAYGANGSAPRIPPKTMLIFDVEFLGQSDTEPQQQVPASTATPTANAPGSSPAPTNSSPEGATPGPQ